MKDKTNKPGQSMRTEQTGVQSASNCGSRRHPLLRHLAALFFLAAATLIGLAGMQFRLPETCIVLVYVAAVVFGILCDPGWVQSLAYSLLSTLCFNFFFTSPRLSFLVDSKAYILTFTVMTVVALIISLLMSRMEAMRRQNWDLYVFQKQLAACPDQKQIEQLLSRQLAQRFGLTVRFASRQSDTPYPAQTDRYEQTGSRKNDSSPARTFQQSGEAEKSGSNPWIDWPVDASQEKMPVESLQLKKTAYEALSSSSRTLAQVMVRNAVLALERLQARQEREAAIEQAGRQREQTRLLQSISHDIRTPLTRIILDAQQVEARHENSKETHALCEDMIQEAVWLQTMSSNILQLTRLQSPDGILPALETVPIEEPVLQAVRLCEAAHPGLRIDLQLPEEVIFAPMDPTLITQVILNLLDNASRCIGPDGTITIRLGRNEDDAIFSVCNTGRLLDETERQTLFEPFHKTDRKTGHFGLGLSLCQTIAKAHHGSIRAENMEDGHGVCFTLLLPLQKSREKLKKGGLS